MSILTMNCSQLRSKCKELGIKNYSSKNKSQLIDLIQSVDTDEKEEIHVVNNSSPLRYPGGKTRACKIIDQIISQHFDVKQFDTLLSPFFGGGSFEFYFQNKYQYRLYVNDKFTPLYHFWMQVKENKQELCAELRNRTQITKDDFTRYRKTIMDLNENPLQQAVQYFIINRCSFSGATLSGGFSEEASKKRYTPSCIRKIEELDLSHVELFNLDFEDFITRYSTETSLLFLDPPYYLNKNSKLYGNNGDMHESFDHQKLFDLMKVRTNWIITYNDCEYIRNLYKDYHILDASWSYGMNKTKKSSEIIILSMH